MDLQQCWTHYLKAEQLLEQGHWPEAYYLYDQVLAYLPSHVQQAMEDDNTKPCQFRCLTTALRDAAITQSEILNKMGQHQRAFELLNQTYAQLQFMSIEPNPLVEAISHILHHQCEDLLHHMTAFCSAQRSAQWMLELQEVQKAHHHFATLKTNSSAQNHGHAHTLN